MQGYPHYLTATCIIKDEAEYMPEWLEYHLLIGVEKFYIYDNGSEDSIKKVLKPYIDAGLVEYQYWPGDAMQMPAYRDCVMRHKCDTHWLAVIDIDEFIVSDAKNVAADLKEFEDYAAVVLQWLVYGNNYLMKKQPGLVIERFKAHSPFNEQTQMCKSIINPRRVELTGLHIPSPKSGFLIVNTKCKAIQPCSRAALYNGSYENMHINHYIFKSYEEFLIKKSKGDALSTKTARFKKDDAAWAEAFREYNHNEITNDPMMDEYIDLVKQAIKKRYTSAD